MIIDHLFPRAFNNEDKGCKLKATVKKNLKPLPIKQKRSALILKYGSAFKQAARILKYGNTENFFVKYLKLEDVYILLED